MLCDGSKDRLLRRVAVGQLIDPWATRMQDVPRRTILRRSPPTRIVVAEAIDDKVPDRAIPRDQHPLGHSDPDIIKNEKSAAEVTQVEVGGLRDGVRVFPQPV